MDYLTDEEQVERLRAWWKEYGLTIVGSIVLAILIVVGWRFYHRYEAKKAQSASMVYTAMVTANVMNQPIVVNQSAKILKKDYSGTPYASIAALLLAKDHVNNQQYKAAIKQLRWVMVNGSMNSLMQVARIRAARIFLQLKEPKQALSVLTTINDEAYRGLIAEEKGDAYLQMGEVAKAKQAYKAALAKTPNAAKLQPILAMKLADLPN